MQSRLPMRGHENGVTSNPYSVFEGFTELFSDFEQWTAKVTGAQVHGHLFAPAQAEFSGRKPLMNGGLCDSAVIRDYAPEAFLTNLIWNTRGERQCFQFGPSDNQEITGLIARDPNAQVSVISGAWAVPLFHSNRNFAQLRSEAARLQKIENEHLKVLRAQQTKARVRIWTMADFIETPMEILQQIIDEIDQTGDHRLTEAPIMVDLSGFGQFLQNLKNQGMHPYLMGDFPVETTEIVEPKPRSKPYLVQ